MPSHFVSPRSIGSCRSNPSWISTIYGLLFVAGDLMAGLAFAVVIERILFNYKPMSLLLRPSFVHDHGKFHAHLHHGLGLLLVLAVADHLGGKPAGRNHLVLSAACMADGNSSACSWCVFHFFVPVLHPALAALQARHYEPWCGWRLDVGHPLRRSVLAHRAELFAKTSPSPWPTSRSPSRWAACWIAYFCHNLSLDRWFPRTTRRASMFWSRSMSEDLNKQPHGLDHNDFEHRRPQPGRCHVFHGRTARRGRSRSISSSPACTTSSTPMTRSTRLR